MTSISRPILSIIVPCYNEEAVLSVSVHELLSQLEILIVAHKVDAESYLCLTDDGSSDTTWEIIKQLSKNNSRVKGIHLSANFGHQNALLAGLFSEKNHADCLITIDADLQDDVTVIEQMIDKFAAGNKIVYGVRSNREKDTFLKRSSAQWYYKLLIRMGIKTIYNHADFRLASRQVIQNLERFNEVNLFLRGIFPLMGFKSDIVYYSRADRKLGNTKYPFRKMMSFAWQGITSFNTSLLRLVTITGVVMFILSMLTALWVLIAYISGNAVQGWASLLLITSLFSGINMISLGLIGEYVGKIFLEVKQRPRFIIEEETERKQQG